MVKGMKGKNGSFDAEVRLCNAGENKGKLQFIQNWYQNNEEIPIKY